MKWDPMISPWKSFQTRISGIEKMNWESMETKAGRIFGKYYQIGESYTKREFWSDEENPTGTCSWILFSTYLWRNYLSKVPPFLLLLLSFPVSLSFFVCVLQGLFQYYYYFGCFDFSQFLCFFIFLFLYFWNLICSSFCFFLRFMLKSYIFRVFFNICI